MNRTRLLNNLNRKRNNLIKQGARLNKLDELGGKGFSVEKLGNLSDKQLKRMYERVNEYGSVTVHNGAILPNEYLRRVKARAKFNGRDPNTIPLRKSYGSVKNSYIMNEFTSVANMLGRAKLHQERTQKQYCKAIKEDFGLNYESFKLSQMPRLKFNQFLNEVGYYATASYVFHFASDQDTTVNLQDIAQRVKRAINNSKTYKEFKPNLTYYGKDEGI